MLLRTEGIVLKSSIFGEADLIITYLTPESGIIRVFAKSPRKTKSRFGSSLEPLTQSRISFWGKENSSLPRLTQSDILHPFQALRNNLDCYLKVSGLIELIMRFLPENSSNRRAYSLLLQTMRVIESDISDTVHMYPWDLIINAFKVKLMYLSGFAPKLDECGRCGKHGNLFYVSQGTILCDDCSGGEGITKSLSPGVSRLYANLLTWDIAKIQRIKPSDALLSGLSDIVNMHIRYILSAPL
jgi:DNA repair protein RecO (recombination protein O)